MYIYQADLWCDDCGREIKETCGEDTGDSGDYPQYVDDERSETDSPSHCASDDDCINAEILLDGSRIGCLLGETLTNYGKDYVIDAIMHMDGNPYVLALWANRFADQIDLQDDEKLEAVRHALTTILHDHSACCEHCLADSYPQWVEQQRAARARTWAATRFALSLLGGPA